MLIKNSQKLLGHEINKWMCNEVTVDIIDNDTIPTYVFSFFRQIPVVNSAQQIHYTMTRSEYRKLKLRILNEEFIELQNDGCITYEKADHIGTLHNFIILLERTLPN